MKNLKNVNLKILKKSIIGILLFIIFLYSGVFIYSYVFEQDKIKIDKYNFEQLEKSKLILNNISTDSKKFFTLKDFNNIYDSDIKPIKNCYYISNSNGKEKYIFGFQLESLIYKFINFGKNYVYPKYDLPPSYFCGGSRNCSDNMVFNIFYKTISNPCRD
ncbi:MAG: hypothetical protein PHH98_02435 [Candidatus Gracilibacteria bacterium]|nr:hypothetical protein [Candidatus Gracilibacteria bacterium]